MKTWTEGRLVDAKYKIENAQIKNVSLNMRDDFLNLVLSLEGDGWCVCMGAAYNIGCGHVGADDFIGCPYASEYIMRIMDTVGVSDIMSMNGKFIRVASKGWGSTVKIFGNIIKDKWFDYETFFADKEREGKAADVVVQGSLRTETEAGPR